MPADRRRFMGRAPVGLAVTYSAPEWRPPPDTAAKATTELLQRALAIVEQALVITPTMALRGLRDDLRLLAGLAEVSTAPTYQLQLRKPTIRA